MLSLLGTRTPACAMVSMMCWSVALGHVTRPPPRSQRKAAAKQKQHDRALKRVTRLKNEARQALRHAKRQGETGSTLHTLAANFLSLLRTHSRLRRALQRRLLHNEAKSARERCHQDFWRYAKELFEGDTSSRTSPDFSASSAHSHFFNIYSVEISTQGFTEGLAITVPGRHQDNYSRVPQDMVLP